MRDCDFHEETCWPRQWSSMYRLLCLTRIVGQIIWLWSLFCLQTEYICYLHTFHVQFQIFCHRLSSIPKHLSGSQCRCLDWWRKRQREDPRSYEVKAAVEWWIVKTDLGSDELGLALQTARPTKLGTGITCHVVMSCSFMPLDANLHSDKLHQHGRHWCHAIGLSTLFYYLSKGSGSSGAVTFSKASMRRCPPQLLQSEQSVP